MLPTYHLLFITHFANHQPTIPPTKPCLLWVYPNPNTSINLHQRLCLLVSVLTLLEMCEGYYTEQALPSISH